MSDSAGTSPRAVCISRAPGAGGEQVGRIVASELGYGYVDEEIVERAAERLDVPADLVADVEERKSLLGRLLPEVATSLVSASVFTGVTPPSDTGPASEDYRDLIQQAIHAAATEGEVVIVAHAASMALAGRDGVLRVLITASPEVRAGRLAEERGLSPKDAGKLVAEGDRARADYFRRFYDVKQELPTHYDLVVNTDVLSPEAAARLVLAACNR
jgi:cytidylate kinase